MIYNDQINSLSIKSYYYIYIYKSIDGAAPLWSFFTSHSQRSQRVSAVAAEVCHFTGDVSVLRAGAASWLLCPQAGLCQECYPRCYQDSTWHKLDNIHGSMGFCDPISYVRQISSCKSIWLASTVTYVDQHTNSCSASHRSLFSTPFVGRVPYLWRNVAQRSDLQPERCITFAPWPCPKSGVICGFNYLLLCVGCPDDDDDDEDDDEDKDEGDGDDEDEEND